LLKKSFQKFLKDDALNMSASLSFYAILSLIPFFALFIILASMFVDFDFVLNFIVSSITNFMGETVGDFLKQTLTEAGNYGRGSASVIGFSFLLFAGTALIARIQDSINKVWETKEKNLSSKRKKLKRISKKRLKSILVVMGSVLIFIVFVIISLFVNLFSFYFEGIVFYLNFFIWFIFMAVIFSLIFKYLPKERPTYRKIIFGSLFTAFLFVLGQLALSEYFRLSNIENVFGFLGGLIILILWIYYSSIVFFFGAEFTYLSSKAR
jgi:membrane protein